MTEDDLCPTCGATMNPFCESGHHLIHPLEHGHELDDELRARFCRDVMTRGLEAANQRFMAYLEASAATAKGH